MWWYRTIRRKWKWKLMFGLTKMILVCMENGITRLGFFLAKGWWNVFSKNIFGQIINVGIVCVCVYRNGEWIMRINSWKCLGKCWNGIRIQTGRKERILWNHCLMIDDSWTMNLDINCCFLAAYLSFLKINSWLLIFGRTKSE